MWSSSMIFSKQKTPPGYFALRRSFSRRRIVVNLVPCMYSQRRKEERRPAAAHCGQSRALLLRCFGHVQSYTPSAAHTQNTTLPRTASADGNGAFCLPRRFGRVQKYTPCAARAQNTFLDLHCIRRCKQAVLCFAATPIFYIFHINQDFIK